MKEIYGNNNTIHKTNYLNVEVNAKGAIVAVWFRCRLLPFEPVFATKERTKEMNNAYKTLSTKIHAIEIED